MNDFFELKCFSLLRLHCLHLLLKLQTHLTQSLDTIIPLYANLGLQYTHLGYTGKAGLHFAQAQQIMKDSSPSTSTLLTWHLNYAEYYATLGCPQKAKIHMAHAAQTFTRALVPGKRVDSREKGERVWAVGRAGYVLSRIAFEEGELERAMGYVDYAIRVLKTGISAVERTERPRSHEYDPFSEVKPPVAPEAKGVKFGSRLWGFKTVRSLLVFGGLMMTGVLCGVD
jgi:separase